MSLARKKKPRNHAVLFADTAPLPAFVTDLDTAGRSVVEEAGGPLRETALRGGTCRRPTPQSVLRAGYPAPRVQFFVRRARSSRYPPTIATPARPRTSSALVPVRDRLPPGDVAAPVAEALGAPALSVGCAMAPSDGRSISSGWVLEAGVAPGAWLGAGLALDDG